MFRGFVLIKCNKKLIGSWRACDSVNTLPVCMNGEQFSRVLWGNLFPFFPLLHVISNLARLRRLSRGGTPKPAAHPQLKCTICPLSF